MCFLFLLSAFSWLFLPRFTDNGRLLRRDVGIRFERDSSEIVNVRADMWKYVLTALRNSGGPCSLLLHPPVWACMKRDVGQINDGGATAARESVSLRGHTC